MKLSHVQILAIRHGETDWNMCGRLQGQTDIPLNAKGLEQARLMAQSLQGGELAAIYSSNLLRASQTAEKLAETLNADLRLHEGLRERHFGSFQGMTFAQVETQFPSEAELWRRRDLHFVPGGQGGDGESLLAFTDRILQAVDEIASQHSGQQIAIVTHGGVLDVLYRIAAKVSMQAPRTWDLGNTSISRLQWSAQEGLDLLSWSDMSHLEREQDKAVTPVEPSAEF